MKLNKDDLSFALNCVKEYYYDSLNSDYPNKDDQKNVELFRDLEQEADNGTLEIEGYEKVEWIKLDPNNPDTFPSRNHYFIAYGPGYMKIMFRYSGVAETDEEFANEFSIRRGFTHWRPLPKIPV